jgi:hypothetical protein
LLLLLLLLLLYGTMSFSPNKKAKHEPGESNEHDNYYEQVQRATLNRLTREALLAGRPASSGGNSYSDHFTKEDAKQARKPQDKRITELLQENLLAQMVGGTASVKGEQKMEGDVVSLGLHSSFFVEGVKIGWPYPVVMMPQRQVSFCLDSTSTARSWCRT